MIYEDAVLWWKVPFSELRLIGKLDFLNSCASTKEFPPHFFPSTLFLLYILPPFLHTFYLYFFIFYLYFCILSPPQPFSSVQRPVHQLEHFHRLPPSRLHQTVDKLTKAATRIRNRTPIHSSPSFALSQRISIVFLFFCFFLLYFFVDKWIRNRHHHLPFSQRIPTLPFFFKY